MVAVSRFVEFSVTGPTYQSVASSEAPPAEAGQGIRGFSRGDALAAGTDSFTVVLGGPDQIQVTINSTTEDITLASGTDLDPRFVARDIEFKLHDANSTDDFNFAQCNWRNGGGGANDDNSFIIYTGQFGNNSTNNVVNVTIPTDTGRDARTLLGYHSSPVETAGTVAATENAGSYTGTVTTSGSYSGQFDDMYIVMISDEETVYPIQEGGSNVYDGTPTEGGVFIPPLAGRGTTYALPYTNTYTLTIDIDNGASMGQGGGSVPTMSVTDAPGNDGNDQPIELLYANHWYDVGDWGARVKFTDAPFGDGDIFTIPCVSASGGGGTVSGSTYIFSSYQEDSSKAATLSPVSATDASGGSQLGTRGTTIAFGDSGTLTPMDSFRVLCRGPQYADSNVTQLNFGNVTVSTHSPVKVVWFELISGAAGMSTVKFSLQEDGTFSNHDQGDSDTFFRFGTCGAGNQSTGASPPTGNDQLEFPVDANGNGRIVATDLDDSSHTYIYATKANLSMVSSADDAEVIGNYLEATTSDFIWLAIMLGANETGANSTINYRMFFDFS